MRRWCGALLAALLALTLGACGRGGEPEAQPGDVLIYYLAPEEDARGGDRIQSRMENLELPEGAGVRDRAEAVVKRLLEGPADGTLQSPLPGLELLSRGSHPPSGGRRPWWTAARPAHKIPAWAAGPQAGPGP